MAAGISLHNEGMAVALATSGRAIFQEPGATGSARRPTAKYTKVGERLRHVIPGPVQCSVACGGRACKYENPSRLRADEQAVRGVYSSWVTENILAMARPSTETIEKYDVIEQFKSLGISTVINLQWPGEHASCGFPLEEESGFTYLPRVFMDNNIYFYNFCWKDYGVASLTTILDMVKVITFALQEGKVAIHCHAGLGRTGGRQTATRVRFPLLPANVSDGYLKRSSISTRAWASSRLTLHEYLVQCVKHQN